MKKPTAPFEMAAACAAVGEVRVNFAWRAMAAASLGKCALGAVLLLFDEMPQRGHGVDAGTALDEDAGHGQQQA